MKIFKIDKERTMLGRIFFLKIKPELSFLIPSSRSLFRLSKCSLFKNKNSEQHFLLHCMSMAYLYRLYTCTYIGCVVLRTHTISFIVQPVWCCRNTNYVYFVSNVYINLNFVLIIHTVKYKPIFNINNHDRIDEYGA